jgi:hypothetical protein
MEAMEEYKIMLYYHCIIFFPKWTFEADDTLNWIEDTALQCRLRQMAEIDKIK